MSARISGIDFTQKLIDEYLREADISRFGVTTPVSDIRRIKIVHVDLDINHKHPSIAGQFSFYVPTDEEFAERRPVNDERVLDMLHGSSCVAVLKRNGVLSNDERLFWNLTPFADVYSLPVRLPGAVPSNISIDLHPIVEDYILRRKVLEDTFQLLLDGDGDRRLCVGDIIVVTLGIDDPTAQTIHGGGLFPVFHEDLVEALVEKLTCDLGVTVVVSAGNGGQNLNASHTISFPGLMPFPQSRYNNNGVSCGAIMVGARENGRTADVSNFGSCIDTHGPGLVKLKDDAGNHKVVSPTYSTLKKDDGSIELDLNGLSLSWGDTSNAAMFVAALIANVQQVRLLAGFKPLLPYAVRAHLRQWKSRQFREISISGYTPDAIAWLVGTRVLKITEDDARTLLD